MGGINIEVLKCDRVQENVAKMIFFFFCIFIGAELFTLECRL